MLPASQPLDRVSQAEWAGTLPPKPPRKVRSLHTQTSVARFLGCHEFVFFCHSFSVTGHQMVKVAIVINLVYTYLTRDCTTQFEYDQKPLDMDWGDQVGPSI